MKLSGKRIRHKLQVSVDTGLLFFGLVTPEPDYKTSLMLNSTINTRFRSRDPFSTGRGGNNECSFSRFSSEFELNDLKFELISNKSGNCVIDKKLTGLDYLLIVKGHEGPDTKDELINRIRANGEITAVFDLKDNISIAENILLQIY